jgi:hypothetical protein
VTVAALTEKLSKLPQDKDVILLVGIYWGEIHVVEQMGDTVILEADKKQVLE